MSDVREKVADVVAESLVGVVEGIGLRSLVATTTRDAILDRFEVTARPVVTAEELGRMVCRSLGWGAANRERYGKGMLDQLDAAGLVIVRREEVGS